METVLECFAVLCNIKYGERAELCAMAPVTMETLSNEDRLSLCDDLCAYLQACGPCRRPLSIYMGIYGYMGMYGYIWTYMGIYVYM